MCRFTEYIRFIVLLWLMAVCLAVSAAGGGGGRLLTLRFIDEPLPSALKRLEKAGGKSILFTYKETERYKVTAHVRNKTQAEALAIVLGGKPFAFVERDAYFVVQYSEARQHSVKVHGRVTDQKGSPLAYANVVMLAEGDKSYIAGCVTAADGTFALPSMPQGGCLLKVSYVGYKTAVVDCRRENNIAMEPDAIMLKGVEVNPSRPMIERKGSTITANVAGSTLSMTGSAADLLSYLPFVTGGNGKISVIGRGNAEIYINGRKVYNQNELNTLQASEILKAEIIMNPGARYSSEVGAVIRLKTIRLRGQGFSGMANVNWWQRQRGTGSENFSLNYRTGGLDIFMRGALSESNDLFKRELLSIMTTSPSWKIMSKEKRTTKDNILNGEAGFNYEIDSRQSFGMRYAFDKTLGDGNLSSNGNTDVWRDGEMYDNIETESDKVYDYGWNHSVNAYYTGTFGKWGIDFNADYYCGRSSNQFKALSNSETDATSYNDVHNSLYAAKLVVTAPLFGGELAFGTEETFTDRKDRFTQSGFSANADDHLSQHYYSAFADYTHNFGRFQTRIGVRYEHQRTIYYEAGVLKAEQSPTYNDILPSASVDYSHGDWNFSLAYRLMKLSPGYSMLSSATSYNSKYEYYSGNPLLVPQKHNYISFDGGWKWINFSLWYDYTLNMYTSFFKPYDETGHPGVILETKASLPYEIQYGAAVVLTPKFGVWQPQLTTGVDWYTSDASSLGIPYSWNRPKFSFTLQNIFSFKNDWFVYINGNLSLRAKQSYAIGQQSGSVRLSVVKTFFKDKSLRVSLTVNDVFNTGRYRFTCYGDRTYYDVRTWSDSQRIGVSVNYTFNATKTKYKGKGAGRSEKERLK